MKKTLSLLVVFLFAGTSLLWSHCQVPCGIYDDHARVVAMLEDAKTVRKAALSLEKTVKGTDVQSTNQLVRWVMNKESHAQAIISSISDYFLTQRVKVIQRDYVQRLMDHHAVILLAMKAKQTSDLSVVDQLEKAIAKVGTYYPPAASK